jgi:hypothetical protein
LLVIPAVIATGNSLVSGSDFNGSQVEIFFGGGPAVTPTSNRVEFLSDRLQPGPGQSRRRRHGCLRAVVDHPAVCRASPDACVEAAGSQTRDQVIRSMQATGQNRLAASCYLVIPIGALTKSLGETGGTLAGKDREIRVRTGNSKLMVRVRRGCANGVFSKACVETKGLNLAPQVGLALQLGSYPKSVMALEAL